MSFYSQVWKQHLFKKKYAHLFGGKQNLKKGAPVSCGRKTYLSARRLNSGNCFLQRGSITVEAAAVIPLFLLAVCTVLGFAGVLRVQILIQEQLCETGKQLAKEGYIYQQMLEDAQTRSELLQSDVGQWLKGRLEVAYVREQVTQALSEELEDSVVVGGKNGLSFLYTELLGEEMIDLTVSYRVRLPVQLIPLPELWMTNRCRMHAWIGAQESGKTGDEAEVQQVFVTPYGEVYHVNPACTHLQLSIREVRFSEVEKLRNKSGGRYTACECASHAGNQVYITDYGDRYHGSLSCSGLKRGIRKIPITEASGMRVCSKCGQTLGE